MSQLQDDYAKSTADKEKSYQDERLNLFMQHQDKVKQLTQDLQNEQQRMQATGVDDQGQAKLSEIQTQLDQENSVIKQNNDLKAAADVLRSKNDLQLLQEKHQTELKTDQEAYDDKMAALKKEMQKEIDAHKEQTEKLKEETIKRFDTLLQEYQKGYEKLITESKAKHAELLAIETQVQATVQSIQNSENTLKAAPTGTTAILPHLASGGIVTKPTVALIGEAGPEAIVPLNRGSSSLSQPISVSIMEGAVVNVSNQADETRLARTVAKELAKVLQGNRFGLAAQM